MSQPATSNLPSAPNPSTAPVPERPWNDSPLRRYAGIYAALWRNSVVREMGFKSNFILWIFVEVLWFALQLSFAAVIYQHTDSIAGWSKWEVVLLMGVSHFVQQLFTAFFLVNLTQLSDYVRTGKLDFMLLLPVNTRFLVSFRTVDLGGFVNATSALCVIAFAAHKLGLRPGPGQIAGFLAISAFGVCIHYSMMSMLTCISFFTVRAQSIAFGYYNLFNIARQPGSAFHGFFRIFFTFVIPMLLVANVPAKVILGKLDTRWEMLLICGLALGCLLVSELAWKFSIRRYTSASS